MFGRPLERFDEGILLNAVAFLADGTVPGGDAYQPYGPAYGAPAVPLHWLLGAEVVPVRLVYAAIPALVTALAYIWLRPRVGVLAALAVALLTLRADVARYSLAWACVFAFLIASDTVIRRCSQPDLATAWEERPRQLALAGGLLGLAAWFRLEYAVFGVVWIAVAWAVTRRRPPLIVAAAPLAVASVPWLAVLVSGGFQHLFWWLEYALFGFREFRSQPVNLDLPFEWVGVIVSGGDYEGLTLQLLSYFAGAALVAAVGLNLLLPLARRYIGRDATALSAFLVCVAAIVTYAQSVRYHQFNGYQAVPLIWAGFAALAWRPRWIRPVVLGLAVIIAVPVIADRVNVPGRVQETVDAYRENGRREPVDGLRRASLNAEERAALPALLALWRQQQPRPERVMSILRRNDDAQGNEALVPWFVGARPAAWPTTYDPGLADRGEVQREVVDDLCDNRAALVQTVGVYPQPDRTRHASRYLDQFVALNYEVVGAEPLHRLLRARAGPCLRPEAAGDTTVRRRRDQLLREDDAPAAGALSTLLIERARTARRAPDPSDAAVATIGTFYVDDRDLPTGQGRAVLTAVRDGRSDPAAFLAAAADRRLDAYTRLAAISGFARLSRDAATPEQGAALVDSTFDLMRVRPWLPQLGEAVTAVQPASPAAFRRVERLRAGGLWLDRWKLQYHAGAAGAPTDPAAAVDDARRVVDQLRGRPVEQGDVLKTLADVYGGTGNTACANAALRTADALPGVDPGPFEAAPGQCPGLPAAPG